MHEREKINALLSFASTAVTKSFLRHRAARETRLTYSTEHHSALGSQISFGAAGSDSKLRDATLSNGIAAC